MFKIQNSRKTGVQAALLSALLLGLAPVVGKYAISTGFSSRAIVAYRAGIAFIFLFLIMLIFWRRYFYIYPVGLVGCILAGVVNGIGSLFYYAALEHIDASQGQLIYSLYPVFVALWLLLDRQPLRRLTILRLILALPAVYLVVQTGIHPVDLLGVGFMLIASCLYALHLIITQWVLYEVPSPAVTLYTLFAIGAVVIPFYLIFDRHIPSSPTPITFVQNWWPILGMGVILFLSRLVLFMGIKNLGGMQTALLGLAELLVAVFLAQVWLGEHLSLTQWIGAGLLSVNLVLVGFDRAAPEIRRGSGWFA